MRRLRFATLASALACAVAAAPAAAHEFAGPTEAAEASAVADGAQQFAFRPFRITCERAHSAKTEVAAAWPAQTLALTMSYTKCKTHAGKVAKTEGPGIPTKFLAPVEVTYHANGFVELGAMEIAVGGDFKCLITTEAQTIPARAEKKPLEEFTAATFVNEEVMTNNKKLPIQHQVVVNNAAVKAIHFTLSEGFCEELEVTEGKNGAYTGQLKAQVRKTNLSWK